VDYATFATADATEKAFAELAAELEPEPEEGG